MKTEATSSNLWTNVELPQLTQEASLVTNAQHILTKFLQECLPEIGCQVSSLLSDLDVTIVEKPPGANTMDTMELIVLRNNEFKLPQATAKENTSLVTPMKPIMLKTMNTSKVEKPKKPKTQDNFEDMLYFVCNLCPFLCTKDAKITEHVQNAHKNKSITKLLNLKCPACQNVFYHKVSLRSHLIHDHGVGNSELNRIIQAVVYFTKNNKVAKPNVQSKVENGTNQCKNEMEVKYLEKMIHSEKILQTENEMSDTNDRDSEMQDSNHATDFDQSNSSKEEVCLPKLDISQENTEKLFNSTLKRHSTLTKYLDQKKLHKCVIPLCKVKLEDPNKMNYHISSHTDNSYKCLECGEQFSFWNPLRGHLWRVHKVDMELYSCDKCDYKTFSLGKLNSIHKPIHSDVKSFVCTVCEKAFKNAKQLRNHKETHREKSSKAVHVCEFCNKSFFEKRQLRVHTDGVHKKIKPFLCNYCGYKGSSKSALKMHIRQHTGTNTYAVTFHDKVHMCNLISR